jgi:hypothetical protein
MYLCTVFSIRDNPCSTERQVIIIALIRLSKPQRHTRHKTSLKKIEVRASATIISELKIKVAAENFLE